MWLETTLLGLGSIPDPPTSLIIGAKVGDLPQSIASSTHVVPVAAEGVSEEPRFKRLLRRVRGERWESPLVRRISAQFDVDVWVGFTGFEGLGDHRALLIWFPDFQFRHFPQYFEASDIAARERQWKLVAQRADGIVAISGSVRTDAIVGDSAVSDRIHIAAFPAIFGKEDLTVDPDTARLQYSLPEKYFMVSNQFCRHKNHQLVLSALALLKAEGKTPPVIAFTGRAHDPRDANAFNDVLGFVHRNGLHEYCRFLGVIPRADQVALVRGAQAVVQPSQFEGRGAIAEEAELLGTQILCSDIPVHRELDLREPIFFGVDDVRAVASALSIPYLKRTRSNGDILSDSHANAVRYGKTFMRVLTAVAKQAAMRRAASGRRK